MTELQQLAETIHAQRNAKKTAEKVLRMAAPAPGERGGELTDDEAALKGKADAAYERLVVMLEAWATWCYTRRFYAPMIRTGITLGNLAGARRPFSHVAAGGPDANCSPQMIALNTAIHGAAAERDAAAAVFVIHYRERPKNITAAAQAIGISRGYYYKQLERFSVKVLALAAAIEADNLRAGQELAHSPTRPASAGEAIAA